MKFRELLLLLMAMPSRRIGHHVLCKLSSWAALHRTADLPVSQRWQYLAATHMITHDVVSKRQHGRTLRVRVLMVALDVSTMRADGSDQTQQRTLTFRFLHL